MLWGAMDLNSGLLILQQVVLFTKLSPSPFLSILRWGTETGLVMRTYIHGGIAPLPGLSTWTGPHGISVLPPPYFPSSPQPLRRWEVGPDVPGIACGVSHALPFCFSYFTNCGKGSESFDVKYRSNCLLSLHSLCLETAFRRPKTQLCLGRKDTNFSF